MKKFLLPAALYLGFLTFSCFSQNRKIDSLLTLLKTDKADTNKVIHANNLSIEFLHTGLYDTALCYGNVALQIAQRLNFKKGSASSLDLIGLVYWNKADYPKAIDYYFKALKLNEETGNKNLQTENLIHIGTFFSKVGDYPKALNYYFKALKIAEQLKNKNIVVRLFGNLGVVCRKQGDYVKALAYYLKALKLAEELENKNNIATIFLNIGNIYIDQSDYVKALDFYFKSLKIDEELGNKNEISILFSNIGSLYTKTGKFKEAELYLKRAITMYKSVGSLDCLEEVETELSKLYDTIGQPKLALIHYKKAMALKDTIFSQENKKQLVRKEMNYEFDKKEAVTKAENDKQQAVAEEKNRQQKIVIWSVAFGLLLVLVFAGFIFRSLRAVRRQKNIIEAQKNEVTKQKDIADSQRIIAVELREISEKQKHIVEEKQKEILDSITYARRIQTALLTSDEYIKNNLQAEYFILFKPKDIVSGDFYWALRNPPPSGETGRGLFYIATADCTGHGVPGAFMSMLNISYLNENVIERGIRLPHDILNAQRTEIIKALNPPGSTEVSKDGMDCILCAYDFDKMLLHFAAANNPLWLVRNSELIEYKADKMPVGKYMEDMLPFTPHTIELRKGDIIYTSTDGFADQFGANGKKMMKKTFKEELLKIQYQPMAEQKEYLNKFFENWKGKAEQVDDVCVIGVRV